MNMFWQAFAGGFVGTIVALATFVAVAQYVFSRQEKKAEKVEK